MNVPMDAELKKQLLSDTGAMKDEALESNAKLLKMITAARKHSIVIAGPGFDINVRAAIPGPIKDKFVEAQTKAKNFTEYAEIRELMLAAESELVAAVCVDEELADPDVWVEFEIQTGLLDDLVKCILRETTSTEAQVQHFRKKS